MEINAINDYSTNFNGTLRINVGTKKNPKYYDINTSNIAGITRGHNTNTKKLAFIKLLDWNGQVENAFGGIFGHDLRYNADIGEVVCTDRTYNDVITAYTAATKGENIIIEA